MIWLSFKIEILLILNYLQIKWIKIYDLSDLFSWQKSSLSWNSTCVAVPAPVIEILAQFKDSAKASPV